MRRSIVGLAVAVLVVSGGYGVYALGRCGAHDAAVTSANTGGSASCADPSAATCEAASAKIAGQFDPAMSGVCRFACATTLKYTAADVASQPGAKAGQLTQCPVSGVVFAVDASRPHVRIADHDYATCCDKCAEKLKRDPRHYMKV